LVFFKWFWFANILKKNGCLSNGFCYCILLVSNQKKQKQCHTLRLRIDLLSPANKIRTGFICHIYEQIKPSVMFIKILFLESVAVPVFHQN